MKTDEMQGIIYGAIQDTLDSGAAGALVFAERAASDIASRLDPPLTLAVRQCGTCGMLLGVDEWRGDDAHDGERWCITHGLCGICLENVERECDKRESIADADGRAA